jgi:hypothetical protein
MKVPGNPCTRCHATGTDPVYGNNQGKCLHCGGTGGDDYRHPLNVLEKADTYLAGTGYTAGRSSVPQRHNIVDGGGHVTHRAIIRR